MLKCLGEIGWNKEATLKAKDAFVELGVNDLNKKVYENKVGIIHLESNYHKTLRMGGCFNERNTYINFILYTNSKSYTFSTKSLEELRNKVETLLKEIYRD